MTNHAWCRYPREWRKKVTTEAGRRWSSSSFYNSDVPWLNVVPSFHLNTDSFS
ncbi:hypothetical protein TRIUR3_33744 [Triticum urartu]|uniref:Uncharacterized protein n=1 Tax=Triticum urartu TaxID=4572 RepID=M8B189_TRIUA|nr:hypothetical protein TRIUR3_33744 [Triticum urartu]